MTSAGHHSMMSGAKWKNPYQTPDNALVAMWDGLEGGFVDLFGHAYTETSINRVSNGIYCTSGNAVISIPSLACGTNGSFTIECAYSGFPLQGRRNFLDSYADGRGFTFYNINGANGIAFEAFFERSGSTANSVLRYTTAIPSSGTVGCYVDASDTGATKALLVDGAVVATQAIAKFAYNDALTINPWLNCTLHNIRVYSRVLTASESAAFCAIDNARFNLPTS